jgi:tryptophan synthase alpha chain
LNIFLITPQTSKERIRQIDDASEGFIYMVSSASTTGAKTGFGDEQTSYFQRIAAMKLKNPLIVGFGISNAETFQQATKYTSGAIIGSAFIKHLTEKGVANIPEFIKRIR